MVTDTWFMRNPSDQRMSDRIDSLGSSLLRAVVLRWPLDTESAHRSATLQAGPGQWKSHQPERHTSELIIRKLPTTAWIQEISVWPLQSRTNCQSW